MTSPDLDTQILDFIKEVNPSGAYLMGFNDKAGQLFIASEDNLRSALRRLRSLRAKATTDLQKMILDSLETALLFDEPQPVLDDILGTIFAHLVKEGVNDDHMISLFDYAMKDLEACTERFSGKDIPVAVKALTMYRLDGVLEIIDTVRGETKSPKVKKACDSLRRSVSEYVKLFQLEGWGKGEFSNVEKIFTESGFDLARQNFYPDALRKAYDYTETPEELEKNAISWIDEELPKFRKVTSKLAKKFGCDPTPELVEAKINARTN